MPSSEAENTQRHFFELATQYYAAGRFAALAQMMPVAANLLHHAIEMYLKGALAIHLPLPQLKAVGHRLTAAWTTFKAQLNDNTLSGYDAFVAELDEFETIRYPDAIVAKGMAVRLTLLRSHVMKPAPSSLGVPEFELVLEDVDALVQVIFEKAKMNPSYFFGSLNEDFVRYRSTHNHHVKV